MLPAYATCLTRTSRLILHFAVTRLRHCTYRFSLHFISVAAFHFKFKLQSSSPFSYFLFRLDYFFLRRFRFQVFFSRGAAGRLSCSVYSSLALQWQGEDLTDSRSPCINGQNRPKSMVRTSSLSCKNCMLYFALKFVRNNYCQLIIINWFIRTYDFKTTVSPSRDTPWEIRNQHWIS